jgi:hypothetical protein
MMKKASMHRCWTVVKMEVKIYATNPYTGSMSRIFVISSYLEFRTMDKAQKPSETEQF